MHKLMSILLSGLLLVSNLTAESIVHATATESEQINLSTDAIIFSGNGNLPLAKEVAEYLNVPLGDAIVSKFNDGEIRIKIEDSVRNKNVFIIQSNSPTKEQSVNDSIMELFLLVRTMKRASAASITAIIPYYGYARQDRKVSERVPISAADIALMLEMAGVDRVVTVDIHCGQIQGFFQEIPVDNLNGAAMFVPHFTGKDLKNVVVVSPDAGGVDRAKRFGDKLAKAGIPSEMAMISKERAQAGVVASMNLIGDVHNADVIIVDDICDTGGTLVKAAQLLKDKGARRVFAAITHPVFSNNAVEKIRKSVIEEMVVANTVRLRDQAADNICTISVGPLLGEAIRRIAAGESLSVLCQ
jgi:ribose-phosphate pyrophosphokinase